MAEFHETPSAGPGRTSMFRALSLEMLIVGALVLYFGFALVARAPMNIPDAERDRWFASQNAAFLVLRIAGVGLLAAAAAALAGLRSSLYLALAADGLLVVAFGSIAIIYSVLAWITGVFDIYILLAGVFAIISVRDALQRWHMIRATAAPLGLDDES